MRTQGSKESSGQKKTLLDKIQQAQANPAPDQASKWSKPLLPGESQGHTRKLLTVSPLLQRRPCNPE